MSPDRRIKPVLLAAVLTGGVYCYAGLDVASAQCCRGACVPAAPAQILVPVTTMQPMQLAGYEQRQQWQPIRGMFRGFWSTTPHYSPIYRPAQPAPREQPQPPRQPSILQPNGFQDTPMSRMRPLGSPSAVDKFRDGGGWVPVPDPLPSGF